MISRSTIFAVLITGILFLVPGYCRGQQGTSFPLVHTQVSPTSGTVGDRIFLEVDVTAPDLGGLSMLPLDIQETTWTIEQQPSIREGLANGGLKNRIYTYTLRPFATGRLTVPRVAVSYAPPGQTSSTVLSEPLWVEIDSTVQGDISKARLKEATPPASLPIPRSVVWTGFIFLLLVLAGIGFLLWRRYAARLRRMLGGILRPDELALKQINQLEDERLIEQKKIKELYTRLSDTVRYYLDSAYGVHAADLTSTELLRELDEYAAEVPIQRERDFKTAMAKLSELLDEADLVKFARLLPEASQCRRAMQAARDVVTLTNYRFKPDEENEGLSDQPGGGGSSLSEHAGTGGGNVQ